MKFREILFAEAAFEHERGGERVAHRERERRARGRHDAERIGLALHADVENDVRLLRQRRIPVRDDGDDLRAHALKNRQQTHGLRRRPALGNQHDGIARQADAQVAVDGVRTVQENRRRARGAQRRDDLLPDQTGLADAGDDDLAVARVEDFYRLGEVFVETGLHDAQRVGFGLQNVFACFNNFGVFHDAKLKHVPARK